MAFVYDFLYFWVYNQDKQNKAWLFVTIIQVNSCLNIIFGQRKYVLMEEDPSVNKKWVRPEIYAYPLFYVSRPLTLRSGKA